MKVTQKSWDIIKELRTKQDQNAFCLGALEIEHEDALMKVENGDQTKRGALLVEREDRREFFMKVVRRVQKEQQQAGEAALREVGVDPSSGEYAIQDGEVLCLVSGRWLRYETAQSFIAPAGE